MNKKLLLMNLLLLFFSPIILAQVVPSTHPTLLRDTQCDRSCLYSILDEYLTALKANDATVLNWSAEAHTSENNVLLKINDGLWGTFDELDSVYQLRFADEKAGQVAFYGVVIERGIRAPMAVRLKIVNHQIAEAETLVVRNPQAGVSFLRTDLVPQPRLLEILEPEQRRPRARMISIADGYFDTLQLNDGQMFTEFTDDCERREDGFFTTNNPDFSESPVGNVGCAEGFELGFFRWDDRVRDRRFLLIDEERGLILTAAFIDHEGRLLNYQLTDGREVMSPVPRPHSLIMLETFKIKGGKIEQAEAIHLSVPYNMPSVWPVN